MTLGMGIGFDADGNPLALPGNAIGFRIRRSPRSLKPHAVITGADGTPLILALDAGPGDVVAALAELDEAQPGRYRLEPVDQHARPVGTEAAFWDLRPQLLAELGKELGIAAPASSAAPDMRLAVDALVKMNERLLSTVENGQRQFTELATHVATLGRELRRAFAEGAAAAATDDSAAPEPAEPAAPTVQHTVDWTPLVKMATPILERVGALAAAKMLAPAPASTT